MAQPAARPHLTRTQSARARRITVYMGRASATCEICPRYVRPILLSDRGWCPDCEVEFTEIMASLQRMGLRPIA